MKNYFFDNLDKLNGNEFNGEAMRVEWSKKSGEKKLEKDNKASSIHSDSDESEEKKGGEDYTKDSSDSDSDKVKKKKPKRSRHSASKKWRKKE